MKRGRLLVKLAYFTRKIQDPYNKGFFTTFEAFVPKPNAETPLPCILVAIRNGHQRLFFRVASVKELTSAFSIPQSAKKRLAMALVEANHETDRIEKDYKLLFAQRHLAPGGQIVRTDTGEVLANSVNDVERYLRGKQG